MKVWNTCLFKKKTRCWIQHHTTSTRATRFDALSQKVIVPMQISKILHDFQFYLRDYSNWQQCDWFFSNFQNSIQKLCAHTKSAQWIWKKNTYLVCQELCAQSDQVCWVVFYSPTTCNVRIGSGVIPPLSQIIIRYSPCVLLLANVTVSAVLYDVDGDQTRRRVKTGWTIQQKIDSQLD